MLEKLNKVGYKGGGNIGRNLGARKTHGNSGGSAETHNNAGLQRLNTSSRVDPGTSRSKPLNIEGRPPSGEACLTLLKRHPKFGPEAYNKTPRPAFSPPESLVCHQLQPTCRHLQSFCSTPPLHIREGSQQLANPQCMQCCSRNSSSTAQPVANPSMCSCYFTILFRQSKYRTTPMQT